MFPGGPGIPSAPLRPGRPGGPWEETEEDSYGEAPTCGGLTHIANTEGSSPAPRDLLEVLLVLWLQEALPLPAHIDNKYKVSCVWWNFIDILKVTAVVSAFPTYNPVFKNLNPEGKVRCCATKCTNLRSWRAVWSCNLCALQKFNRNSLFLWGVWLKCNHLYQWYQFNTIPNFLYCYQSYTLSLNNTGCFRLLLIANSERDV